MRSRSTGSRCPARTTTCFSSPTSATGWSRAGCRHCPAWARRGSSASGGSRCASGSPPPSWRRAGSPCRTCSRPSGRRNVEMPAGRIESDRREFTVRSLGELKTPEEFSDLVVPKRRRAGQAQGRRPGGARGRRRAERAALQRDARGRHRRGPAVQGQHDPGGRRDPGRAAPDPAVAAAGRPAQHGVRRVDLREALDPGGRGDAGDRGAAWW